MHDAFGRDIRCDRCTGSSGCRCCDDADDGGGNDDGYGDEGEDEFRDDNGHAGRDDGGAADDDDEQIYSCDEGSEKEQEQERHEKVEDLAKQDNSAFHLPACSPVTRLDSRLSAPTPHYLLYGRGIV